MNRRTGNTGYIPPFVGIFSTVRSSDLRLVHRGYVKADWSENAQNRPQNIGYIPPFVGIFSTARILDLCFVSAELRKLFSKMREKNRASKNRFKMSELKKKYMPPHSNDNGHTGLIWTFLVGLTAYDNM